MVELRIDMKGGGLKWCKKVIRGEWGRGRAFLFFVSYHRLICLRDLLQISMITHVMFLKKLVSHHFDNIKIH